MSEKMYKTLLGVLGIAAIAVMGWALWSSLSGGDNPSGEKDVEITVLCSTCGYLDKMTVSQLAPYMPSGGRRPAIAPMYGPGYKCPKCGKQTLYPNPIKCPKCGTYFLLRPDASGAAIVKCPKCGWTQ